MRSNFNDLKWGAFSVERIERLLIDSKQLVLWKNISPKMLVSKDKMNVYFRKVEEEKFYIQPRTNGTPYCGSCYVESGLKRRLLFKNAREYILNEGDFIKFQMPYCLGCEFNRI